MTKGITRISNGFLARHYWGKSQPIQEYFYDNEYGSKEAAEKAAESWLKRIADEFPAPEKSKRQPGISYTYVWHGLNRVPCIEVFWTSYPDEKKHHKQFAYNNDLEKKQAEHDARLFLEARKKEIHGG